MCRPLVCEACRASPVEIVSDVDDPAQPYYLCRACEHRLQALALRPLEWFNLAAAHGPNKFLLHDDFYYHNGKAGIPREKVAGAAKFPAPNLREVRDDLERLLDYAMTLFWLRRHRHVVSALRRFEPDAVLAALRRRTAETSNPHALGIACEICTRVLGRAAQDFVREQWANAPPLTFLPLAEATAVCLPFEEGFSLVLAAFEGLSVTEASGRSWAFAYFRTRRTLDWMEAHESLMLHDNWGRVAAQSHFSWKRAESWLAKGRPFSLRALQALTSCSLYDTVLLKDAKPKLEEQAPLDEMTAALNSYLQSDPVPNVRRRVALILDCWQKEQENASPP